RTCLAAMEPLVRATVDNVFSMGPGRALTGPIARGDVETVRRHLKAIEPLGGDLDSLYRAAGRWTVELARSKSSIDDATADALRRILGAPTWKE
ncbi:MAG TPA: DUF2520 domain-containing protein, partial [Phycisphaerae bacterium]|nr:DUF2520 domain-containing protein [Phycisphaerae bacterium]